MCSWCIFCTTRKDRGYVGSIHFSAVRIPQETFMIIKQDQYLAMHHEDLQLYEGLDRGYDLQFVEVNETFAPSKLITEDVQPPGFCKIMPFLYFQQAYMRKIDVLEWAERTSKECYGYLDIDRLYLRWLLRTGIRNYHYYGDEELVAVPDIRGCVYMHPLISKWYKIICSNRGGKFDLISAIDVIRKIYFYFKDFGNNKEMFEVLNKLEQQGPTLESLENDTFYAEFPTSSCGLSESQSQLLFPCPVQPPFMTPNAYMISEIAFFNIQYKDDVCPIGFRRVRPYVHQKLLHNGTYGRNIKNPIEWDWIEREKIGYGASLQFYNSNVSNDNELYYELDIDGPLFVHRGVALTFYRLYGWVYNKAGLCYVASAYQRYFNPALWNETFERNEHGSSRSCTIRDNIDYEWCKTDYRFPH